MESRRGRTRLYVFPGGMVETTDHGDGDGDDAPGFYLAFEADRPRLPRRGPGPVDMTPIERADAETCARALQLLRALGEDCSATGKRVPSVMLPPGRRDESRQ